MRINSKQCPYCKSNLVGQSYTYYDPELREKNIETSLECIPCRREIDISDYFNTQLLKKETNDSVNRFTRSLGRNVQ